MGLKVERKEEAGPWRREVAGEREREVRAEREGREEESLRERGAGSGRLASVVLAGGRVGLLTERRVGCHLAGDVEELRAEEGSIVPG
jgi:hypothetical protein